jgi:hypothetical protein
MPSSSPIARDSLSPSMSIDSRPPSTPPIAWLESDHDDAWAVCLALQADDASATFRSANSRLTPPPSPHCRHLRPPTLQPNTRPAKTETVPATSSHISYNSGNSRQNVRDVLVNASSAPYSIPHTNLNVSRTSPTLESASLSGFCASPDHAPINSPRGYPTPVFHSTSALASYHGIPQLLPPAPRTTPRNQYTHEEIATPEPDFLTLRTDYLTMLSQNPSDVVGSEDHSVLASPEFDDALMQAFGASPEARFDPNEFMTSPFDSPFDDFLQTPALGTVDGDISASPLIGFEDFSHLSLWSDSVSDPASAKTVEPATPARFDGLLSMPSPTTPSLDPSPMLPPSHSSFTPPPRKKSSANGTRKNITPDALLPVEAPIQPRKYVTPSRTSRKELPAVFARKRARSMAFGDGDDEDQLLEELRALPPNPTEAQRIEAKRLQNTIAARRSRRRKLETQMQMEETLQQLQAENAYWKSVALACKEVMALHGLEVPEPNL